MLPIDPLLPEIAQTLATHGRLVLQAPPGAGKTTRVPLALRDVSPAKIIMLEPRRLAARAAAERLAAQIGERPGQTIGYRMRGDTKPGTKIEVVTEGILTRMIQNDPELPGISAVIFDEFHERSLNADLGLALTLELRDALRPDLHVVVMSATLDAAPVAALMGDAPLLTSEGRAYPVDIRHLPRPLPAKTRLSTATADLIETAWAETEGGMLVFLPGEREIRDTERLLTGRLGADARIQPLYGALPFAAQQAAIQPCRDGRKLVLATSIAETSLTIEDIRVVVDAGRARRSQFDPATGMSRLVTDRVTRAEATQRTGRAGRVAPGTCYRLWAAAETGALLPFPAPEIAAADLTGLALDLAQWGSSDLPFLTPPPQAPLAEARSLLSALGALDARGTLTDHGRAMGRLPLHPRLAHMLLLGGAAAAPLAALLSDKDPMRGAGADLTVRLRAMAGRDPALNRLRQEAKRLAKLAPDAAPFDPANGGTPGLWASLAYPDRIALRRNGSAPRWLLSGGRGATMAEGDAMAGMALLVATDLDGGTTEARIRHALPLSEAELHDAHGPAITTEHVTEWSRRDARVHSRARTRLGALTLTERATPLDPEHSARAMVTGIRQIGLRLPKAAERFRKRVALVRANDPSLPDLSDDALLATLEDWLLPYLEGVNTAEDWKRFDPLPAMKAMLDWPQTQTLDAQAPSHFTTPLGRKVAIDYDGDTPTVALRLQELFGTTRHPMVGRTPIKLTLLSPAQRPVQVTTDLPGFWDTSYADVRKDMRGRYPKHPWPEDPTQADPTLRAKPRGT